MLPLLDNLLAWFIQLCAVSLLGTVLPLVFTIRHPRTQLAYGYAVLAVCLLLPFVQPYRPAPAPVAHRSSVVGPPAVEVTSRSGFEAVPSEPVPAASQPTAARVDSEPLAPRSTGTIALWWPKWSIREWLLVIFAAGALVRLSRLTLGAWQIRRYRLAATPFYPVPASVVSAGDLVGARALVCLSRDVSSPATLGLFRPVILMPASFLMLEPAAQEAVACHEFLHVRRRDWGLAMIEGVISAVLWFTPVTWLISEIRLAREQVVDEEVVSLTSAKDSYIQALLDIARARPTLDIVPAPMFIRRRHLTHRVQALLDDASDSFRKLSICYASTAVLLVTGTWMAVAMFPLVGLPRIAAAAAATPPVAGSAAPAAAVSTPAAPPSPAVTPRVAERVPVLVDQDEPIVGALTLAASPAERAAALALLERARQNGNLHIAGTPAFHLEASFDAFGEVSGVGSGVLTETWMSGQRWRWTATLGPYAQVRVGSGNVGYDQTPVGMMPLRVHMLRAAIFVPVAQRRQMRVRSAPGKANGRAVTCVLFGPQNAPASPVRLWNEEEYCVDAAGRLLVHSPVLGVYTRFGYRNALQFGGRVLPGQIAVVLGGNEILAARLSIREAGENDEDLFRSTPEMVANGTGPGIVHAPNLRLPAPGDALSKDGPVVVVHVAVEPSGRVRDAELVTTDSPLGPTALEIVKTHPFANTGTQREGYVGVDFQAPERSTP